MEATQLYERAWTELKRATTQRKHPFHTPCLSTVRDGVPQSRIVVLRYAEGLTVGCHADVRSPKAIESGAGPTSWLFYSFPDKMQVRVTGRTVVHHMDEVAKRAWEASQLLSRRCYLAPEAPGVPYDEPFRNMPVGLEEREPTEEESIPGFQNFSVLRTHIEEMEVLWLEYGGNLRCRFVNGQHQWLAP